MPAIDGHTLKQHLPPLARMIILQINMIKDDGSPFDGWDGAIVTGFYYGPDKWVAVLATKNANSERIQINMKDADIKAWAFLPTDISTDW